MVKFGVSNDDASKQSIKRYSTSTVAAADSMNNLPTHLPPHGHQSCPPNLRHLSQLIAAVDSWVLGQQYAEETTYSNKWQRATSATNMSQNIVQLSTLKSLDDNKTQSEKIQHQIPGKTKYTTTQ